MHSPQFKAFVFVLLLFGGAYIAYAWWGGAPEGAPLTEYRNDRYQFSFSYPGDLIVEEFDEGGGAATIIFQREHGMQGFQIFIVPYKEASISEERFRMDVPSDVRNDARNIALDGAQATEFWSIDEALGDTYELWTLKNGYLYEITTFKEEEAWLKGILETWDWAGSVGQMLRELLALR